MFSSAFERTGPLLRRWCKDAAIPLRRAAPPFLTFIFKLALFDTTSRALGGSLELCWRTSRASHPSEDLSEPPPLLETVAGREYHCVLTGSSQGSLPGLLLSGWGPLSTLFCRSLMRILSAQVVLAHPTHRFPFSGRSVRERIPVAGYDRLWRCFSKSREG